jgi:hypothetical protein
LDGESEDAQSPVDAVLFPRKAALASMLVRGKNKFFAGPGKRSEEHSAGRQEEGTVKVTQARSPRS